jgi:hypothetical protein
VGRCTSLAFWFCGSNPPPPPCASEQRWYCWQQHLPTAQSTGIRLPASGCSPCCDSCQTIDKVW